MGLFDIFKQKRDTDNLEQHSNDATLLNEDLDFSELMVKALKEPSYKRAFYQRLRTEDLVVISMTPDVSEGYHYLKEGTSVELFSLPDGTIPIFTTVNRIFDNGIVKDDVQFLQMTGADLFGLTKGAKFIINPYSDHKKKISPADIEALLNGMI